MTAGLLLQRRAPEVERGYLRTCQLDSYSRAHKASSPMDGHYVCVCAGIDFGFGIGIRGPVGPKRN